MQNWLQKRGGWRQRSTFRKFVLKEIESQLADVELYAIFNFFLPTIHCPVGAQELWLSKQTVQHYGASVASRTHWWKLRRFAITKPSKRHCNFQESSDEPSDTIKRSSSALCARLTTTNCVRSHGTSWTSPWGEVPRLSAAMPRMNVCFCSNRIVADARPMRA